MILRSLYLLVSITLLSTCGGSKKQEPVAQEDDGAGSNPSGSQASIVITQQGTEINAVLNTSVEDEGTIAPGDGNTSNDSDIVDVTIAPLPNDPITGKEFLMLVHARTNDGTEVRLYYLATDVTLGGSAPEFSITFRIRYEYVKNTLSYLIMSSDQPITPPDGYDPGGDVSGDESDPTVPPSQPFSFVATAVGETQIDLTWVDNSNNESNFRVERSTDDVSFTLVNSPAADSTSYSDTGLSAGTTYYYRLNACNSAGCSNYARVGDTTLDLPDAPSGFSATSASSSAINLAWTDNSSNETRFEIERGLNTSSYANINDTAADATAYADSSLTASTTYFYRIRACNADGCSAYVTDSATTSAASFQRIFVTSSTYDGNFSGLANADALCQSIADGETLGGTWKAVLSDSTEDANSRITISGEIRNMNGDIVADDSAEFWGGSLKTPVGFDEAGNVSSASVWSGTQLDGNVEANLHCVDWTDNSMVETAGGGVSSAASLGLWIQGTLTPCDNLQAIYCIDGQ